jgi:hypothetical protein
MRSLGMALGVSAIIAKFFNDCFAESKLNTVGHSANDLDDL